jgi:hypothetical protein
MGKSTWLVAIAVLVAFGLFAGCGSSDDSSSSSTAASSTTSSTESTDSGGGTSSGGSTPDDVYNACLDAISGTPAVAAVKPGCAAARDAFEQCTQQASNLSGSEQDTAVQACQDAADKATAALKAGS